MSGMVVEKNGKLVPRKRQQIRHLTPSCTVLWNYRRKSNQCGLCPIHIEIYVSRVDRRYYEVQVPQKVAKAEWSGKDDCWVKHSHPFAFEINNQIRDTLNVLKELNKRYYMLKKPLTMFLILRELNKDFNLESFNEFFRNVILDPPEKYRGKFPVFCIDSDQTVSRLVTAKRLPKLNLTNPVYVLRGAIILKPGFVPHLKH